eukprot:194217-Prymnesium_polylepis.1
MCIRDRPAIEHNSIAATDAAVGGATSGPAALTAAPESAAREGPVWAERPAALACGGRGADDGV